MDNNMDLISRVVCQAIGQHLEREPSATAMQLQVDRWTRCTLDRSACAIATIPGIGCQSRPAVH